jgi:CheY-like chemotaxis protein
MESQMVASARVTKRILVADDNEDIRNLISLILTSENYEVFTVSSGTELIQNYPIFHPDLILLDIMMPHMSGFEVLQALRVFPGENSKYLPIIMITAKSLDGDIDRALDLGANSYIVKPFRANTLLEQVARHLSERKKK